MKIIFSTFLLTVFLAVAALAQGTPGPSAAIFAAPKAEEIKEFVSENDKFKVDLPGAPIEKKLGDTMYSYLVYRPGTGESVVVQKFPQDLDKEKNRAQLYTAVMAANAVAPDMKVSDEKDIALGKHTAKQFVTTYGPNGTTRAVIRLVFAGNRMYQLNCNTSNWHMLNESGKKEFETEMNRFFDSFKLIEDK